MLYLKDIEMEGRKKMLALLKSSFEVLLLPIIKGLNYKSELLVGKCQGIGVKIISSEGVMERIAHTYIKKF